MSLNRKYFVRVFITLIVLAGGLSINTAFADNILSAIQINPDGGSYKIVLKSDQAVPIKKIVEASDKLSVELQNIQALPAISTIYNNVPNVENVVVKPMTKNSIKIMFEGKNISNSKVDFDVKQIPAPALPIAPAKNTVKLNKPLKSYAPIFEEETTPDEGTSNAINMLPFKSYLSKFKNLANTSNLMYLAGIILIIVVGVKTLKGQRMDAPAIGLARQQLKSRSTVEDNADVKETLMRARRQLPPAPKAPAANYGLRSYQNNQRSPYTSTSAARGFTRPAASQPVRKPAAVPQKPVINTGVPQTRVQKYAAATAAVTNAQANLQPQRQQQSQPITVDSTKFIESMSKIYEKNGRSDLAAGLRNNLLKAQDLQNQI